MRHLILLFLTLLVVGCQATKSEVKLANVAKEAVKKRLVDNENLQFGRIVEGKYDFLNFKGEALCGWVTSTSSRGSVYSGIMPFMYDNRTETLWYGADELEFNRHKGDQRWNAVYKQLVVQEACQQIDVKPNLLEFYKHFLTAAKKRESVQIMD